MATGNHTGNYNLSQYAAGDPVKFLTNYNQDMAAIDAAVKSAKDSADAKTPLTRTVAGLPLTGDITLAQLIAAGLSPAQETGTWTPAYYAGSTEVNVATTRASYVKTGKTVLITLATAASDAISDSGALTIDGLPFVPAIDGTGPAFANTANKPILARAEGTKLYFHVNGVASATKTDMPDFSYIRLSVEYEVS